MENFDDKLTVLIRSYREKPPDERKIIACIFCGIVFAVWLFLTFLMGKIGTVFSGGNWLIAGLQAPPQIFICVLILLGIGGLAYYLHCTYDVQNKPIGTNKGGKASAVLMSRGTAGSSRFMTDQEIRKKYSVGGINTEIEDEEGKKFLMTEDILGQLESSKDGSETVTNKKPKDPNKIEQNNNIVFGASGRGKSFGFVRPLMIMAGRRGSSVVVTDPSGELYSSMSDWYKSMGYKIVCFNANNIAFSDCWDFFTETTDIETGRLKQSKLDSFCSVYFDNAKGDSKKDFWYSMELLIFRILVALCSWQHEDCMMTAYKKMYLEIGGSAKNADNFSGMTSFVWCRKEIMKTAKKKGISEKEVLKAFEKIEEDADKKFPFTIARVLKMAQEFLKPEGPYRNILNGNTIPEGHPAKMDYNTLSNSSDTKQQGQYVIGLLGRLSIFNDWEIRTLCSNKGIDLRRINREKTAVFVCTSDKQSNQVVVRPIVSLLFTFLFDDIMDSYDHEEQLAISENRKNSCIPVSIILDELFSIGTLGAKDEKTNSYMLLPTVFAEARKRKITNTLIVQDVTMLESLYGKNGMSTLINNTKNQISLGVYDQASSDYLSKLLGKTTVMSESHKFGERSTSVVSNLSETSRDLKTAAETRMLEDYHLYLQTAGNHPAMLKTVPYTCIAPFCYADERKPKVVSMRDRPTLYDRDANGELRKDSFDSGFKVPNVTSVKDEDDEEEIEDLDLSFDENTDDHENTEEIPIVTIDESTGEEVEAIDFPDDVFGKENNESEPNFDGENQNFDEKQQSQNEEPISEKEAKSEIKPEESEPKPVETSVEDVGTKTQPITNELGQSEDEKQKDEPQPVEPQEQPQNARNKPETSRRRSETERERRKKNINDRNDVRNNNRKLDEDIDF